MLIQADARQIPLADRCVQCVVTSPPYFGLRDYGTANQIGLEPTPDAFVAALVAVFREVRRVLKDDGVCWLNLGDSYYGAGQRGDQFGTKAPQPKWRTKGNAERGHRRGSASPVHGLKFKDQMGMPWRVAFALQQPDYRCEACNTASHSSKWLVCPPQFCDFTDGVMTCPVCAYLGVPSERIPGWYLRSDVIWSKPNPMPESVTDRPTKAHEYLFLLTKSERYFYDAGAIREPHQTSNTIRDTGTRGTQGYAKAHGLSAPARDNNGGLGYTEGGRNRRTVWTVPTMPYSGAHFATMPEKLVEPCILAGSRLGDRVLDPFMGSGTVGAVAERLGRRWVGLDLNPAYHQLAKKRTAQRGLRFEQTA